MTEIIEFLRERFDQDGHRARNATPGPWGTDHVRTRGEMAVLSECGTEVRGELLAVGLARLPEVEPLKEGIVPVVTDDNSVDMGAFTLPQYVMAYDIKGFGVVGYEPFIRPVGAAVDQFACTGC